MSLNQSLAFATKLINLTNKYINSDILRLEFLTLDRRAHILWKALRLVVWLIHESIWREVCAELITVTILSYHEVYYFAHLSGIHPEKFLARKFHNLPNDHRREAVVFLSELNNKVLKKQPKVCVIISHEANEQVNVDIHRFLDKVIVSKSGGRLFQHWKTPFIEIFA